MTDNVIKIPIYKNYEKRFLCLVDLLGWKNKINEYGSDAIIPSTIISALYVKKFGTDSAIELFGEGYSIKCSFFSDTIIWSCPSSDITAKSAILQKASGLASHLLGEYGIGTRGAIVEGDVIHNEGILIGPAVIEAVENEKHDAIFPRIIVKDEMLAKMLIRDGYSTVTKYSDNIYFVELFYRHTNRKNEIYYLEKAKMHSRRNMETSQRDDISKKWEWMCGYLETIQ